jgi:hypothetical protein
MIQVNLIRDFSPLDALLAGECEARPVRQLRKGAKLLPFPLHTLRSASKAPYALPPETRLVSDKKYAAIRKARGAQ